MDVFEEARQLSSVPLFSKLDTSKLKLIAFTSEQVRLSDGDYLFHYNDPSDSVYLVLAGILQIVVEHEDGRVDTILDRGKNDMIGEMGVISNSPRSASIRASGTATVLRIEADAFMALLSENPGMSLYVMRELTDRLNKYVLKEQRDTLNHSHQQDDESMTKEPHH